MMNKQFEAYKIKREIKRSGQSYTFKRKGKNKFGEPIATSTEVAAICGLYHEQNSSIAVTTGTTTQTRTKKIPSILCLCDDATSLVIGDFVIINSKTFVVTGVTNIQEWNIISDISLEVADYGS